MFEKICQDCGGDFVSKAKNTRYCPNCIKKRQSQFAKERNLCRIGHNHNKPRKGEKVVPQETPSKKQSICDSYCRGCYYLLGGNNGLMTCDYFEKADKLRPCPAGKGCTERRTPSQIFAERKEQKTAKEMQRIVCVVCGTEFSSTSEKRKA